MIKITITAMLDDYLHDESRLSGGAADGVFLPEGEVKIAELLRECQEKGIPVTISGARTGIVGGAVPRGGIVIATERLAGSERIALDGASDEWRVRLDPGMSLNTLHALACTKNVLGEAAPYGIEDFRRDERRYFSPIDATEASVGGMAATNASGALSHGYGAIRAYIRALRVALAGGETVRDERPAGIKACRSAALEYFDAEALRLADRAEGREQLGLPSLPPAGAAVYFEQCCREAEIETLMDAWSTALDRCRSSIDDIWSALKEKERVKLKALRHLVPEEVNRLVESNRRR